MFIFDFRTIGNTLLAFRKQTGMTQAEVAESAGISDRTYADIERGTVNMRVETLLRICQVLCITPNEILINENTTETFQKDELIELLDACNERNKKTALQLLSVYLHSLK